MNLTEQKCVPCEGGMPALTKSEAEFYLKDIKDWRLEDDTKVIRKDFKFKDFKEAMQFVNKIADVAENEGHHPDIFVSYNKVSISLSTHAIKGLSVNDFIVAAKIDMLHPSSKE